jgi:hypothetical protein
MENYGRGENKLFGDTYVCGEAMANTNRILKYSTAADRTLLLATDATEPIAGVMPDGETYLINETIKGIQLGRVKVKITGTVTAGDRIKAGAAGVGVTFGTTGAGYILGFALTSGVSGDIIEVFEFPMFYNAEGAAISSVTKLSGGILYIETATSITGDLTVVGNTDLTGTFDVTGATTLTGATEVVGTTTLDDLVLGGHKDGQSLHLNAFQYPVPASEMVPNNDGAYAASNLTAVALYLPLSALKAGDEIVSFILKGAITNTSDGTTTVDCSIYKVADDGTNTLLSGGAMTQVSKTAAYTMSETTTFSTAQTIATGFQYVAVFAVTTPVKATATINGIELAVNRK